MREMRSIDQATSDRLLEGDLTDFTAAIEEKKERNEEPEWVLSLRTEGLEAAQLLPLPNTGKVKMDQWNLNRFTPFLKGEAKSRLDEIPQELRGFVREEGMPLIVQENGGIVYEEIPQSLKEKGVLFMGMERAIKEHEELVRKYFLQGGEGKPEDRLFALHMALWSGGIFLYVPANVVIEEPLLALFTLTKDGAGMNPHVILVAEENSKVSYVEARTSRPGMEGVHLGITELYVGKGASLTFAGVYRFSEQTTAYDLKTAYVDQDGLLTWNLGEMGDGNMVAENVTRLIGRGASTASTLIGIGTGDQKSHFVTKVIHHGKNTNSDILAKGVLLDRAMQVYSGITKIEKGATKANGEQTERLMMLSGDARGDANPILLIDEDDVKCGHAASVGRIDATQLYYLMSRGIPRKEAERLLILGFLQPVLEGVPLPDVRKMLLNAIEGKLRQ